MQHQADAHDAAQAEQLTRADYDGAANTPPKIGEVWPGQGGIYAGLIRNTATGRDEHLIVGPAYDGAASWKCIDEWARSLNVDGHTDFHVMQRPDGWICQANVPELFEKDWYWLEQHESDSTSAWHQIFSLGNQYHWLKDNELRARAVRRLAIS